VALSIAEGIEIPDVEIEAEYSRSSGPGGQHVNKTETRVTLRFSVAASPSIPEPHKTRMLEKLGPRLTKAGELLVSVDRHRDRSMNESKAFERLTELRSDRVPGRVNRPAGFASLRSAARFACIGLTGYPAE
jgi:ribosome-associated protein